MQLFQKGRHTVEYRFRKKDGTYCWVNDEQHLVRDKDGQPVEVVGSWSDVTARKEAEIAFRQSEQRLTDAIESISEGFSLYDAEDRLIVCNRAYGELLYPGLGAPAPGTPYEELIRTAARQGLVEDAKGRDDEWIAERLARHRIRASHTSSAAPTAAGSRSTSGKTTEGGTVAVYTNITEIKRAEEEIREAKRQAELAQRARDREEPGAGGAVEQAFEISLAAGLFARYSPASASVEIASSRKKLTMFFSDIVDFTATTDELESEELTGLLNRYLTEMAEDRARARRDHRQICRRRDPGVLRRSRDARRAGRTRSPASAWRSRCSGGCGSCSPNGATPGWRSRSSCGSASIPAIAPSAISAARTAWTTRSSAAR